MSPLHSHYPLMFCSVVQEHFCNCMNMPLHRCFVFGFSERMLYVNSVCVYSQAVSWQTVWIIYHSAQLCWFANTKNLFFPLSSLAPDKAPIILSVTPHTTTSVLVRWQVRCWITWHCVFCHWKNECVFVKYWALSRPLLFVASLWGSLKWSPFGVQGQVPGVTLRPVTQLHCPHS